MAFSTYTDFTENVLFSSLTSFVHNHCLYNVVNHISYSPAYPKLSYSWDSTGIECTGHVNPTPSHSSENRYFCPRFDAIRHCLWVALALKVAKVHVRIRFWCMLMLGLGPTWLRLSDDHTSSLAFASKSVQLLLSSEDWSLTQQDVHMALHGH